MIGSIKKALESDAVNKSDLNLGVIHKFISLGDIHEKSASRFIGNSGSEAFTFIQLKPVSFEPRVLFSSSILTGNAYEMRVAKARLDDQGEWVPDESNVIMESLISHRVIMESIFEANKARLHPITMTSANGLPVDEPTSCLKSKDAYGSAFRRAESNVSNSIDSILSESLKIESESLSFSKKNTEKLFSSLHHLTSKMGGSDFNHPLQCDSEHFDRDFYQIKKEVQDSMTSHVLNSSTPLIEKDVDACTHTSLSDYFDYVTALDGFGDVGELLDRYARTISDKEESKSASRLASFFRSESMLHESKLAQLGKVGIEVGKSSSSGISLFGENRLIHDFYNLSFSFGCEKQRNNGEIEVAEIEQFMMLYVSPHQMMELIQCSLTGGWIKSTMSRYCGMPVNMPIKGSGLKHSTVEIDGSYASDHQDNIEDLINKIKSLLSGSATKSKRSDLILMCSDLAELSRIEQQARREAYSTKQMELYQNHLNKSRKELDRITSEFKEKHPELNKDLKYLIERG